MTFRSIDTGNGYLGSRFRRFGQRKAFEFGESLLRTGIIVDTHRIDVILHTRRELSEILRQVEREVGLPFGYLISLDIEDVRCVVRGQRPLHIRQVAFQH